MTDPRVIPAAPSRVRTVTAVIVLILAAVLTTPALVAHWGQRTLSDTQRYLATVEPLINEPAVQEAITAKVITALESQVDVGAIVDNLFAGVVTDEARRAQLAGVVAGGVNGLVEGQVRQFVASPAFADIWATVNTTAQQSLIRLLEGEASGPVSLQGDQVVLDVSGVVELVKQRLVQRGLTVVQNVPIPAIDAQIVLLDAPELRQARTIWAVANPVAQWILPLVIVLYVVGLALARNRPRATMWVGAALLVNAVLVALALSVGRQLFVNGLADSEFALASGIFFDTLLRYLQSGFAVLAWLGVLAVAVGWFMGRSRPATDVRANVADTLERVGTAAPAGPLRVAGGFVATYATWLRWASLALGVVIFTWGDDMSPGRLAWAVGVVVALLVAIQMLIGASRIAATAPDHVDEVDNSAETTSPLPVSEPTLPIVTVPTTSAAHHPEPTTDVEVACACCGEVLVSVRRLHHPTGPA